MDAVIKKGVVDAYAEGGAVGQLVPSKAVASQRKLLVQRDSTARHSRSGGEQLRRIRVQGLEVGWVTYCALPGS